MEKYRELELFFIDKILGAFSTYDMEALDSGLKRLKKGDTYVEVGTQHGRSIYCATQLAPKGVKFVAVDIYDPPGTDKLMSRDKFFKSTGLDKQVTYINKPSAEAAADWEGTIDMMFIDADHSYEGVKLDVDSWTKFVKPGGYLYFHDADETSPGVVQLVKEMGKSGDYDELTFYKQTLGKNTSMASLRKK